MIPSWPVRLFGIVVCDLSSRCRSLILNFLSFFPTEDGRVYEHAAIQKHIDNNPSNLKSPITNEPMGKKLLAAVQVKNVIDHAVSTYSKKASGSAVIMK